MQHNQEYSDSKSTLGLLEREIELADDDALYKALDSWLSQPRLKKPSLAVYIPYLVATTDQVMVNFRGNIIALSLRESKDDAWTEYTVTTDAQAAEIETKLLQRIKRE